MIVKTWNIINKDRLSFLNKRRRKILKQLNRCKDCGKLKDTSEGTRCNKCGTKHKLEQRIRTNAKMTRYKYRWSKYREV